MPPKGLKSQPPRESPRSRKTRAEPADAALKSEAAGEDAITQAPTKKRRVAHTASTDTAEAIDQTGLAKGVKPVKLPTETQSQEQSKPKRKRVKVEEEEGLPVNGSSPKKAKTSTKVKKEDQGASDEEAHPKPKPRTKTTVRREAAAEGESRSNTTVRKRTNKTKAKAEEEAESDAEEKSETESPQKTKRKRKTKEEKEAEAMPLAARTPGLNMYIGAHVSSAKGGLSLQVHRRINEAEMYNIGVQNSVTNCVHIG